MALKFLNLDERQGLKEYRAIQRFKTIRYPHLATVTALWLLDEAGNVLDDVAVSSYDLPQPTGRDTLWPDPKAEPDHLPHRLIVATLLCDKNLMDRLAECQALGTAGIPVDELLRYMEEAAKAIDFLNTQRHDLGDGPVAIQHCDIKPANIMLTGGSVMICDFGVAAFSWQSARRRHGDQYGGIARLHVARVHPVQAQCGLGPVFAGGHLCGTSYRPPTLSKPDMDGRDRRPSCRQPRSLNLGAE